MNASTPESASKPRLDRYGRRAIILGIISSIIQLAILLPAAGRIDYLGGWLYAGILFATTISSYILLVPLRPGLLNQRGRPFRKDTASFDFKFFITWRVLTIVMLLTAGIDTRLHPHAVPEVLVWTGFGIAFFFGLISTWPLLVNPHFEVTVRHQEDRGHVVIDKGPYAVVRHPGYAFFMPILVASPFILESWWSAIPALGIITTFLWRTRNEDRFLHENLSGYSEYATQVRYRLFPGIW